MHFDRQEPLSQLGNINFYRELLIAQLETLNSDPCEAANGTERKLSKVQQMAANGSNRTKAAVQKLSMNGGNRCHAVSKSPLAARNSV